MNSLITADLDFPCLLALTSAEGPSLILFRWGSYNVVVLDPDLARAFPSDEAVNKALRLVLEAAQIPEKAVV